MNWSIKMNDKRLSIGVVAGLILFAWGLFMPLNLSAVENDDVQLKSDIAKIMSEKLKEQTNMSDVTVNVMEIKDPLGTMFRLFQIKYLNKDGVELGNSTVSVITKDNQSYMVFGGAVWDVATKKELNFLWTALTNTVDIPTDNAHLILGDHDNSKLKITIFSDYQCYYCRLLLPKILHYLQEKPDIALYFYDMPITSTHKNAKYLAKLVNAWHQLTGKLMPLEFYDRHFEDKKNQIDEYFEDLLATEKIDLTKFYKLVSSPAIEQKIDADLDLAKALNIRGTPAVFVDGHKALADIDKIDEIVSHLSK